MLDQIAAKFDVYKVGGCVRDKFLGLEPKDIDYCVVAHEAEFEAAFPTLKRVGNAFPVYLNPTCGSEIALTRTDFLMWVINTKILRTLRVLALKLILQGEILLSIALLNITLLVKL